MRLSSTVVAVLLLTACTTTGHSPGQIASNALNRQSITSTTHDHYPAKKQEQVAIYDQQQSPQSAYRVIGIAKIHKYNLLGLQRQPATLHLMMKKLAASIGGDGIIDVQYNQDHLEAKVIAFQQIMI